MCGSVVGRSRCRAARLAEGAFADARRCAAVPAHLQPVAYFHELAEATPSVVFVQIDVDDNDKLAAEAGVSAMPTFHVYDGSEKVDEMVGASKDKLAALVEKAK